MFQRQVSVPLPTTMQGERAGGPFDDKVRERTAELEAAVRTLRRLGEHNMQEFERERLRMSRELREMGRQITSLRMEVSVLRVREGDEPPVSAGPYGMLLERVDRLLASLREMVPRLRPPALDDGLVAAIEWQAAEFSRDTGVPCRLDLDPAAHDLPPDTMILVFRIVQESLTNVGRHAQATQAALRLVQEAGGWTLAIVDDGIGFATAHEHDGFGLLSMGERARRLGGSLVVESAPGAGTIVRLRIAAKSDRSPQRE